MNSDIMNQDLVEEIDYLVEILTKSGFFSKEEIMEILHDQFIDDDVDFSNFNISMNNFSNENFSKLEESFSKLSDLGIIAVHNCGYDIEEGVEDIFELYVHLYNNKFESIGFCFYTLEDVEEAIFDSKLKITFGDFENNPKKALEIGKTVYNCLNDYFSVNWDGTVNNQIEINPFKWDKSYDSEKEYEMEGAYDNFTKNKVFE